jgi:type IV secretory pathway VirB4 component
MAGSEYTATFLENAARRIRKRNGGLLVASQNVSEFANSLQGQAVLKQCVTNIFLGQEATEADLLQDMFKLSDGEKLFLMGAQRGQMLVRMKGESATVQVMPFDYEKQLIEKKKLLK